MSVTSSTPLVSWSTARRVARRVNGREPFSSSYLADSLEAEFFDLTREAERLVEAETGLVANGPARVRVTDRDGWVDANVAAFRRLLGPLTERSRPVPRRPGASPLNRVGSAATGAQLGMVLGWMSTRVLGQYDLLLLEDEHPEDQDIVYYVGPNVLALEKRYAFPPTEFRLWLALHECTHRAQFTGVPWLPAYFRSQVDAIIGGQGLDPARLGIAVKHLTDEVKAGRNPIADGGLLAALATPEQQDALRRISGLMALLEGHGDVTMQRAGRDRIPDADRFHRVLHERRSQSRGLGRALQRLLGMEAKMRQYADGERFIEHVEREGGAALLRRVWQAPEHLPTSDEISDPGAWVARMGDGEPDPGA